jgi:Luciferase-like monooxygenase
LRTRQIRPASGVLSVWGRTPATLAMTAATLHQISGGRFVLGLGASTRALVEGFHDTAFEHPAAKLRDVVTKVRALLAGEPAHLDRVPGARPLRLGQPPAPELPIWLAAMGDRTLRVAAELGDGWFPVMVAPGPAGRLGPPARPAARSGRPAGTGPGRPRPAHGRWNAWPGPGSTGVLGRRGRRRDGRAATGPVVGDDRGDPPDGGAGTRTPPGSARSRSTAGVGGQAIQAGQSHVELPPNRPPHRRLRAQHV